MQQLQITVSYALQEQNKPKYLCVQGLPRSGSRAKAREKVKAREKAGEKEEMITQNSISDALRHLAERFLRKKVTAKGVSEKNLHDIYMETQPERVRRIRPAIKGIWAYDKFRIDPMEFRKHRRR